MSKLLRFDRPGDVIFVTSVTDKRKRLLSGFEELLLLKLIGYSKRDQFDLIAWAILPDHFHAIIKPGRVGLSSYMRKIKLSFSSDYRRQKQLKRFTIWQKRFYDHIIRDQRDLNCHIDYIHYNPVKHGLVKNPCDWQFSSFDEYFRRGLYPQDWGIGLELKFNGDFGE